MVAFASGLVRIPSWLSLKSELVTVRLPAFCRMPAPLESSSRAPVNENPLTDRSAYASMMPLPFGALTVETRATTPPTETRLTGTRTLTKSFV